MNARLLVLILFALLSLPLPGSAQHPEPAAASVRSSEPHQFDFLVGDWRLIVRPRINALAAMIHGAPELLGTWHAERTFAGRGLQDEFRITDASGNPAGWVRTLRIYDSESQRWKQASVDVVRARATAGTAEWRDGEMWQTTETVDHQGVPSLLRTRFHSIQADQFSVQQDRSYDGGKTWDEAIQTITATRSGKQGP